MEEGGNTGNDDNARLHLPGSDNTAKDVSI
jgi:hypothetical protein